MGKIYQQNCFRKCDKMGLKEVRKCGGIVMDEQLDIEFKRKAYDAGNPFSLISIINDLVVFFDLEFVF